MNAPRRTETAAAPAAQGAAREDIGNIRPSRNAAGRDASAVECSGAFTTDSYVKLRSAMVRNSMEKSSMDVANCFVWSAKWL